MDALQDEVESLEAILMEDVRVTRNLESGYPEMIETTIFPQVGEESEQYVCITLQVLPPSGYPDVIPEFKLVRPRGLDDATIDKIKLSCMKKLKESLGLPVVFDLMEVVRDHLTCSNLPSGTCVICLYGFSDGDEFTRTECFHYLHSYCLGRHLNALRKNYQEEYDKLPAWLQKGAEPFQITCPVCREIIKDDSDSLRCAMPPEQLQNAPEFKCTRQLRELQQRMSTLFLQQKSRGGIIDAEADSGAVISIETESEMRRRLERKQEAASVSTAPNICFPLNLSGCVSNPGNTSKNITLPDIVSTTTTVEPKNSDNNKSTVTDGVSDRKSNDNSNNNRRHYRGGRRHQHHHHQNHHHHHRDRDRDRERYEHNHISNNHSASGSSSIAANTGGKPTKASTSSIGSSR